MKLAAFLLLALPIWSQIPLPPAGNDWWKTDEGKAWIVYGTAYFSGMSAEDASRLAWTKPIQPLYELAQAFPAPPAQPVPSTPTLPVTLPPDVVKAIQAALAAAQVPAIAPTVPVASAPFVEPSQVLGIGVGVNGLGPAQIQGGDFIAQHIATNTYTIEATDFARLPGGGVGPSATAGVLNILHRFGPVYVGVVGTAGAAEGATGSASGALSGWGVLGSTFGSKPLGIAFAAQTTKIAGAPGPTAQFKLYVTFAWFK